MTLLATIDSCFVNNKLALCAIFILLAFNWLGVLSGLAYHGPVPDTLPDIWISGPSFFIGP
jgi:hypothetical protein